MKSFIAFAALIAVAVAGPLARGNKPAYSVDAELAAIVAAIQSPSTDPATAALLEEQLASIIGSSPVSVGPAIVDVTSPISIGPAIVDVISPISVGPAIVDVTNPISVGPAIIDFPLPDGGVVTAVEPAVVNPTPVVEPSPVVVGEIPAGATPLVQIIVNVQSQESAAVVAPTPVAAEQVADEVYVPGPVNVVDNVVIPEPAVNPIQVVEPVNPISPIQVVEPVVPVAISPVQVAEPIVVEPVQVVEPIPVEPVQVGTPIIPAPVMVLPEELN